MKYESCPCPGCNPELDDAICEALDNQQSSFRWRDQVYQIQPDDTYDTLIDRWCERNPPLPIRAGVN